MTTTNTVSATIKDMAQNVTEFHKAMVIPFEDTTMTIPPILFHSIAVKKDDPRKYFKGIASEIKQKIISEGVFNENELRGKLSTKVQERAWREIIHNAKISDLNLQEFKKAVVIPYDTTTMTIQFFLYEQTKLKLGNAKAARTYFKETASRVKAEMISKGVSEQELRGKVSTKVQEISWLELLPTSIKNASIK